MGTAAKQEVVTTTRQSVYCEAIGAQMIVCQCGWSREAEQEFGIDAIIAGEVAAERWTITQDGRSYIAQWHKGESAGAVYVERWEDGGRAFHGWIDVDSRKIVQAG
jgi:hypothetical protein